MRCRAPKGKLREVLAIKTRKGNGFTVDRMFCDGCTADARALEHQLAAEYQALVDAAAGPEHLRASSACGSILPKIHLALRGDERAA